MNKLKLGSLFDGIGGFPLSAQRHGIEPVWASEIEPFPIKVTQHHFPNMKHLGDITQINGAEIEPVDIITFGSPCQDLSVAGKREGLEGARSGLFMDAARIIREMRTATRGQCPRFAVWENVPGAYSSNKGQDFRAVIEEIAETEIPMPRSGKWATAGMVRTERVDIAWRTFDAQYWGVAQRRKRIFLVADFRGQCAGEILFVEQGLPGHPAEGREAGQEAAATVGDGVTKSIGIDAYNFAESGDIAVTLTANSGSSPTHAGPAVMVSGIIPFDTTQITSPQNGNNPKANDPCHPLCANAHVPSIIIEPRSQDGICRVHDNGIAPTLNTAQEGQRQPCVMTMQPIPIHDKATRYKGGGPTRNNDGAANGFGVGKPGDVMPTLGTGDRHAVATVAYTSPSFGAYEEGCGTLRANGGDLGGGSESLVASYAVHGKDATDLVCAIDCRNLRETEQSGTLQAKSSGGYSLNYQNPVRVGYAVRRLTPTECERLMGFPDGWTDIPCASDTARYKSLGNSVARPCVDFVMSRIAEVLRTK